MFLKEYLREIKLAEQQYGQEEELYPLANMLLRDGDNITDLSLRTVAGARSRKSTDEETKTYLGRNFLKQYSSFPDMVILDEKFDQSEEEGQLNYIYGCIECKKIDSDIKNLVNLETVTLECRDIVYLKEKDRGEAQYWASCEINRAQIKEEKENEKGEKEIIKNNKYKTYERVDGINEIENKRIKKDENENPLIWYQYNGRNKDEHGKKIGTNKNLKINSEDIEIRIDLDQIIVQLIREEKIATGTDLMQLIGEVLWYGKVLYTNGLEWNYIHCTGYKMGNEKKSIKQLRKIMFDSSQDKNDSAWWIKYVEKNIDLIEIKCTQIADLSTCYKHYKENKQLEQEDLESWCNLKYELAKIDWKSNI